MVSGLIFNCDFFLTDQAQTEYSCRKGVVEAFTKKLVAKELKSSLEDHQERVLGFSTSQRSCLAPPNPC